jgi:hypothetical protein
LDVFYDIHYGALTGQIVQAGNLIVSSSDVLWSNTSPAEAALLNGINNDLNGTDNSADFWTSAFQEQCYSGEPVQIVGTALAAPEPMSWVLAGIGGLFASLLLLRRQRQSA